MAITNKVSLKIHNYNYAPGIATYGIDGKTGDKGLDGNNMFYTDYDLNKADDLSEFINKLQINQLPFRNSEETISRKYLKGDIFLGYTGNIHQLITDVADIKQDAPSHNVVEQIGQISLEDVTTYLTYADNRLLLDTSTWNGIDIIKTNADTKFDKINADTVMNIVSDVVDADDNILLLHMAAINNNDILSSDFKIYYDTTDNTYHIKSEKPIVIDSDLKVVQSDNIEKEYDEYALVLTSDDTITKFKNICDKITYSFDTSILDESLIEQTYVVLESNDDSFDVSTFIELNNDLIYVKVYDTTGQQSIISHVEDTESALYDKFLLPSNIEKENVIKISMIYNTEIFIKKAKV